MIQDMNEILQYSSTLDILYVEDDEAIRSQMLEILENFFHRVIVAKDGQEGLEKFMQYKKDTFACPDLILTDIRMPHLDGIEMSRRVLSIHPKQIIILQSAHNESDLLLDVINMGINHFLLKPLALEQLYQTLHKASKAHYYAQMEMQYTQEIERQANEDPLTGISNRRHFLKQSNAILTQCQKNNLPLYICVIDIDKFKEINDMFGHDVGDEVIKRVVDIVQKVSGTDLSFARFGGDEFVLLLQMKEEKAFKVIETIKNDIAKTHFFPAANVKFTVSIGIAKAECRDDTINASIKRADIHLYKLKRAYICA